MLNRLGNLEPFIPDSPALDEHAELSMARREIRRGEHGEDKLTDALVARHAVEGCYGLSETDDRPTIVTLGLAGDAEVYVRQQVQDDFPTGRSEREGALGGGDGLVIRAHEVAMERERDRDLSQSTRVIEGCREGLGLTQVGQSASKVATPPRACSCWRHSTRSRDLPIPGSPTIPTLCPRPPITCA